MISSDNQLQHNSNCLDLIRIVAALQVVFGHMVEHLMLPIEPAFFKATYFLRGVPIFFAISGFLMIYSMQSSSSYGQYIRKRFWRIYPELWGGIFLEIVTLLFLYNGWNVKDLVLFTFTQGTIFQFWTPASLREFGVGTPNGALWTICVMIQFYCVVWFIYKFMKNRSILFWVNGLIVSFLVSYSVGFILNTYIGNVLIEKLYGQSIIRYFWLFYLGMFLSEFKHVFIPLCKKYWIVLLGIAFSFFWSGLDIRSGYYFFWSVFLIAGIIGFAFQFPNLTVKIDISYGLFIYHMIVVNILVQYNCIGSWLFGIITIGTASFLAYLSTITLGKLGMRKKASLLELNKSY